MRTDRRRLASRVPTILSKREKQAMYYATACAYDTHAFSISFDITARRIKTLIYFEQPKHMEVSGNAHDVGKENHPHETTAAAQGTPHTHAPAPRPQPPRKPQVQLVSNIKQKQAAPAKPRTTDKNALSACGSSNLLSEAALAAQARADAAKEQPKQKRARREQSPPALEPLSAHDPSSLALAVGTTKEEMVAAGKQVAASLVELGIEPFDSPYDAQTFLDMQHLHLHESDEGGEIVGYNTKTGENYGDGDSPLPPGAFEAFLIATGNWTHAADYTYKRGHDDGWQKVPMHKGKRGRS